MPWFTIRAIDIDTNSFTHEAHFESQEVGRITDILDINEFKAGDCIHLSAGEYSDLARLFKLKLPPEAKSGEIVWQSAENFDTRPTHTGRELLLMLEGKKPFAAFVELVPANEKGIIPEKHFAPHVEDGRFIKREVFEDALSPTGMPVKLRRVMFAVSGEEWRFSAFLSLWRLQKKYGWNEGFEKTEGYLYGYESEIDPFYKGRFE
jgi:hypothetical protein